MHLAAGEWQQAVDAFTELLDDGPSDAVRPECCEALAEGYCRLEQGAEGVRAASEAAELFRRQGRHADAAWATYGRRAPCTSSSRVTAPGSCSCECSTRSPRA